MKNNICILLIILLCFGLVSINAFESPIYSLDMNVNVEGINVNIDSNIEFNITNETGETAPTSNTIGSYTDSSKNKKSFSKEEILLSNLNKEFSAENRNTINLNYNKDSEKTIPKERNNFAKSGIGIIILLILTISGLAVVTVLLKKQHELTTNQI